MPLDPDLYALAAGKNFGALTTVTPDGSPSTHVMWVHATNDHLTVNTEVHRAKYKHLQLDPRVALTVWDAANPYRYVEARGRVAEEIRGPAARADIDALAAKYMGLDEYPNPIASERVILKIAVERLHKNGY